MSGKCPPNVRQIMRTFSGHNLCPDNVRQMSGKLCEYLTVYIGSSVKNIPKPKYFIVFIKKPGF
jgi:hypothetical protein